MTDLKTLYETDTAAWSEHQAAALRAAALGGSNQPLDWGNLAEEIEDLAKSLRRRLRGQIARIIQHQVKLEYTLALDPRNGWRRTGQSCYVIELAEIAILKRTPRAEAWLALW